MNFASCSNYKGDGRYHQRNAIRRDIRKLEFLQDDNVLDVGCGTGEETKSIATKVRSVTGIDISEEMLAIARTDNPWPNITYSVGDAQTCGDNPEWRERFDKVVSFFAINWCQDHAKALRSILTCLKPGGEALLINTNRTAIAVKSGEYLRSHSTWSPFVKGYIFPIYPLELTPTQAVELLTSCGWTNVSIEVGASSPSTKEQTKLFFKTALGHTSRIPESMQEEYLEDLWQWTLSEFKMESSVHVDLPFETISIHARKP